jgi:hypothetical protein
MDAGAAAVVQGLREEQVALVENYAVPAHNLQKKPCRLLQSETFS